MFVRTGVFFKISLLTISVFFVCDQGLTRTSFATVTKVRGEVTKLLPGSVKANAVSRGDQIVEESSIVTEENSFVRLLFPDNSQVNLGPESKFVVTQLRQKRPDVLTLLKGTLRSKIKNNKKKEKSQHKFYLKTKTAALGIRGTEFHTVYNPDNDVTATLTYKGEVDMTQIDEQQLLESLKKQREETVEVLRRGENHQLEVEKVKVSKSPLKMEENLGRSLAGFKAVTVKGGQYSGTVKAHNRASLPVQVSPAQLASLYRNRDLDTAISDKSSSVLTTQKKEKISKWPAQSRQGPPKEGLYKPQTGEFAPKAGGYLDLTSGIYVPPSKDADYSGSGEIFVASEDVGYFNKKTGEYFAPQGLKLDAKKGFVIESNNKSEKKLLAMRDSLNEDLARDILLRSGRNAPKESTYGILSLRERITKNVISLSMKPLSHNIDYSEDPQHQDQEIESGGGHMFEFDWYHPSLNRFQLITGLSFKWVDSRPDTGDFDYSSDKLMNIRAGGRYFVTTRWSAKAMVQLDQQHFFVFEDNSSGGEDSSIERIMIPKLTVGASGELLRAYAGRFSLDFDGELYTNLEKETGAFLVSPGLGVKMTLSGKYWWDSHLWTSLGLWHESQSYDVEGEDYTATQNMTTNGLFLQVGHLF